MGEEEEEVEVKDLHHHFRPKMQLIKTRKGFAFSLYILIGDEMTKGCSGELDMGPRGAFVVCDRSMCTGRLRPTRPSPLFLLSLTAYLSLLSTYYPFY
jgi:hypothetical protein